MRNTSKMTTLENRFPLLAVEHGCIISKDADITVAFEVELPELYTVTGAEYEAIHSCWCKAIKVLPDYSVVHKQDWFIKERYKPELQKDDMSFLSRSFERHFNERPYLKHTCYLYLTKTTKKRNRMQSNFSTLCRGHIIPKELDRETTTKFLEACEQFERIMNDSGLVRLRRLSTDEIVGTEGKTGLIERYFSLMPEGDTTLQDIELPDNAEKIVKAAANADSQLLLVDNCDHTYNVFSGDFTALYQTVDATAAFFQAQLIPAAAQAAA